MDKKKNFPGAGRFDPINSTYKHRIYLLNGKELVGYSKGLLHAEMPDKTVLLERVILRLFNSGYLHPNRVSRIEFYLNGAMTGIEELVLSLSPTGYQFGKLKEYLSDIRLSTFISRLYDQIRSGNIVTKSLQHKTSTNHVALFDVSRKRFRNDEELHKYVTKLLTSGHPEGQVLNFYYQYRDKWL